MSDQTTNYQCPKCMGPLHYAGDSGKLECEYCGSRFEVAEIEAFYAEKDKKAGEAFEKANNISGDEDGIAEADDVISGDEDGIAEADDVISSDENGIAEADDVVSGEEDGIAEADDVISGDDDDSKNQAKEDSKWDVSGMSDDWGTDSVKMRSYNCPSCGAELICDDTTAATACPYCGNPSIVPGQFKGSLKPDYVIPFKLDKEAAKAALKNHYKGKIFLPGKFVSENHLEEMKGIYVPFWLYDAGADVDCTFVATTSRTEWVGKDQEVITSFFDVKRAGSVEFERIPADGSKKMPNDYMDSIEPFDFGELKSFSTAYLPGYLADKYDVSAKQNAKRADTRCKNSAIEIMENDVTGYEDIRLKKSRVTLQRGAVHYALMPVWTLLTKWNGKDYMFMMNGQTGKMVGDLPVSKVRFFGLLVGLMALFSGILIWSRIGILIVGMLIDAG